MKNIDRGTLLALACGVWFLVLKPTAITAHQGMDIFCEIDGFAKGNNDGDDVVYIYDWNSVSIECSN